MPTIPQLTADVGGARLQTPPVPSQTADQFGAQGYGEMIGFGQNLIKIGAAIKAQQDEVDVLKLTGEYDVAVAGAQAKLPQEEPDVTKYQARMQEASAKVLKDLGKQPMNPAVRTALQAHATKQLPGVIINVQTEGIKRQAERAVADSRVQIDELVDIASSTSNPQEEESLLATAKVIADRLELRGLVTPAQRTELVKQGANRYWELVALKSPDRIMDIYERGEKPPHMDQQKIGHYFSLAVGAKNAQQYRLTQAEKAQESAIKKMQDSNEANIVGLILKGDTKVLEFLPGLVVSRKVGADFVTKIRTLSKALRDEADQGKIVLGLAQNYETQILKAKYSEGVTDDALRADFTQAFLDGQIDKEAVGRLYGKWADMLTHKEQTGKEGSNRSVTQAHTTLLRELATTGPQDKYDPLGEKNKAAAEEFFYKNVDKGMDPWTAKQEAVKLFGPVVSGRQRISDPQEAARLQQAKEDAGVRTGALSKAAVQAMRDQREEATGRRIVQETLAQLPPAQPDKVGFFEGLLKPKTTAQPGGVERRKPK